MTTAVFGAGLHSASALVGCSAQLRAACLLLQNLPAQALSESAGLFAGLPEPLRTGSADSYIRHIAYADPQGAYTVAYLVWRPGQHSPVHGHKTWCAYRVLQGCLTESHYKWDAQRKLARHCGQALRCPGAVVAAQPGLAQIHRLDNSGPEVAISLHIYGVNREQIACAVNQLVPVAK